MKKIIFIVCALLLTLCSLVACSGGGEPQIYTIQYHDGTEVKSISVKMGDLYSMESVPTKFGYDFKGLYDEETDGVQYVDNLGMATSAFADGKNVRLYTRYVPKEYTLVLDYQGAEVTAERSVGATYGVPVSVLPTNLSLENKEFAGWFTQPDCQGKQVADKYGVIPTKAKFDENNFEFGDDEFVTLYAGFKTVQHTLSLYFGGDYYPEEIKVDHGTDIKNVVAQRRINGNAVLTWSQVDGDSEKAHVFSGKITTDMTLYACEFAPVIDFDTQGGAEIVPLVAKSGTSITLPEPQKENCKFIEWRSEDGRAIDFSRMPSNSIKLVAFWHNKIMFDTNGGSSVSDIIKASGDGIILPNPTKEGFVFAGWYDESGERFEKSKMPINSVKLKAGWYTEKSATIHKVSGDEEIQHSPYTMTMENDLMLDMTSVLPEGFEGRVKIDGYFKARHEQASSSSVVNLTLGFYSENIISDNCLITTKSFKITESYTFMPYEFSFEAEIVGTKIYGAMKSEYTSRWTRLLDYYYTVTYPDTTTLYL